MAKEICISSTPHETRLAILEDDQLTEIYYERENEYTLAGSIYNGRVTRVLPGMQSAFVDIGLERDAFLYVTDFIELEDPEEADEIERGAASAAPSEVRPGSALKENGGAQVNNNEKPQPSGGRGDRNRRDRRPAAASTTSEIEQVATTSSSPVKTETNEEEESNETRGKRWRGRRRRRGGARNADGTAQTESNTDATTQSTQDSVSERSGIPLEAAGDNAVEEVVLKSSSRNRESSVSRGESGQAEKSAPAVPFVLPGESLSRYSGTTTDKPADAPSTTPAATSAPVSSSFKPATLIEHSIAWDGSGLLPGETLARHRGAANTEPTQTIEPSAELFTQTEETAQVKDFKFDAIQEAELSDVKIEDLEEIELDETEFEEEFALHATSDEHLETEETTVDATASHNIDPLPPTGFRLFGFGKKKEDTPKKGTKPSNFSPGKGHVEEELIDEEEFDSSPRLHSRAGDSDHDDLEEETLKARGAAGAKGNKFAAAQGDRRNQSIVISNADDFDEDGDEATAGSPTAPVRRDRNDRNGRGRRGSAPAAGGQRRGPSRRSAQTSDLPIISDLLKPGQEILIQIAKEPIAMKGARITSHIALPGRFLVFMPTVSHVGVSRKIESDEERQRLKRILISERGEATGGFIVRTAAENVSEDELRADLRFLLHLWSEIKTRSESSKSPALIYHDLSLIERILRDQISDNFSSIWVDSEADYERIVRFLNRFSPTLVRRVKLYTKDVPLFEHFGIQDEISKALRSKVWLKSGGSIVINQTEALVAIDINTGKFVGKTARLEDTILKTNLDAIPEIVRQIRLRDLGGIIVIDFIDMDERKNRNKVLATLEEALQADRAPTKVLQFNDFGLVAITRKRVKQSLERTLSVPCSVCQATGMVKSAATVCNEVYIELRKMKKHFEHADVVLRVHPETVKTLKSNNARWLTDYEELVGKNILVKSDATLHPEQFDIQG